MPIQHPALKRFKLKRNNMSTLEDKLMLYAKHHLNVLLIGTHGIGKSTITKAIAENLNLRFKYYSASTLDPFADLVGIPVPDKESKRMDFYRPQDLENAEFIMFDELNRAHPRVLNAVLEIIQFKTVNGTRLPNLKMVWAAINPPGDDYQVEELDPALVDRFHQFVKMNSELNLEYLEKKMRPEIAKALKGWWSDSLDADQRRVCTPRRIEYVGMMLSNEIPIQDAFPQGHLFPVEELLRRIRILSGKESDLIASRESILENTAEWLKKLRAEGGAKNSIPLADQMKQFTAPEMFKCRDLLEALPKELVTDIGKDKFTILKRELLTIFTENKIDVQTKYPKIYQAFKD